MIVVVMRLSKNAKRGMKFSNKLDRPNFIHPKIVDRRTDSDQGSGDNQGAGRAVKKRFGSARRSQALSGNNVSR